MVLQAKARALAEEERELSQLRTRLAAKERQWHESAVEHASTAATAQVLLMILPDSMHDLLNGPQAAATVRPAYHSSCRGLNCNYARLSHPDLLICKLPSCKTFYTVPLACQQLTYLCLTVAQMADKTDCEMAGCR